MHTCILDAIEPTQMVINKTNWGQWNVTHE